MGRKGVDPGSGEVHQDSILVQHLVSKQMPVNAVMKCTNSVVCMHYLSSAYGCQWHRLLAIIACTAGISVPTDLVSTDMTDTKIHL